MDQNKIVEITTIEELMEMSSVTGGGFVGHVDNTKNNKKKENKMISRKGMIEEQIFRKFIRNKLKKKLNENKQQENELRSVIRSLLKEGDLSDTHPNRSTGINTLEDVLKKSIPTLRTDYKKLTTDKKQRDSFRAHIVNAVIDALKPQQVNSSYLQGDSSGVETPLMIEPTSGDVEGDDVDADLAALEEAEIEVDIADDEADKKIPVEDDDTPSPEEEFSGGLEGQDETGRNHAYTSYRKISQYVLDAYDSLANPKDKQVFLDYLVTNLKLYFDKFEDELQNTVEEPTTAEYDQAKAS